MRNILFTSACLTVVGCSAIGADEPAATLGVVESAQRVPDEPRQSSLLSVRLSPTHLVRFLEAEDGDLEAIETLHADLDQGQPSLSSLSTTRTSLADLHRHLLPGAVVPEQLLVADARAGARAPEPEPTDAAALSLPADEVLDYWTQDSNWFWQYFYTGGNPAYFKSNTVHAAQTDKPTTTWYKASAFNQSYTGGGWFRVKRTYTCGINTCSGTSLNESVGNRMVTTYFGDSQRKRWSWMDGSGSDPRVALAVRWVQKYGSQVPSGNSCGNHSQYACNGGQRCAPGLKEYQNACYGCGADGQACCKDWGSVPTPGGVNGLCAQGQCRWPGGNCSVFP